MKLIRLCLLTLMFSLRLIADSPVPLPPGYDGASADNPAPLPPGYGVPYGTNPGVLRGPVAPPAPEAPAFTKVIPLVAFDGLPLDQVINALQQDEPDFQAVIRNTGDSSDSPDVKLHLKNVTVPQVLDVLSKKYGWGIELVKASGHPPIYVIAVRGQKSPEWSVSAYCLTPIIDQLMDRKGPNPTEPQEKMDEMRKKDRSALLADVVATVDTAVKMSSDGEAVMIQVHEPTEMLIIRTGPKQREAAEAVLKGLEPAGVNIGRGGPGPNTGDSEKVAKLLAPFNPDDPNPDEAKSQLLLRRKLEMLQQQLAEAKDNEMIEKSENAQLIDKLGELMKRYQVPATQPQTAPPSKK